MPDLEKMLERVSKIKLPGGVVGKVGYAVIAGDIALGTIGALAKEPVVSGLAIVGILLLSCPLLWRLIGFAERNPQAAILEGAEFLVHQQMVIASKSQPQILDAPEDTTDAELVPPQPMELENLDQPEQPEAPDTPGSQK